VGLKTSKRDQDYKKLVIRVTLRPVSDRQRDRMSELF
jgi:hypothetical protein